MSDKTILVWFRNDLRIHDNEILLEAIRRADKVLPVYCFDPFYFTKNASGNPKTGNIRARFLLESVADLRRNLRSLGSELVVRTGSPAEILPQLAEEYQVSEVYHHREVAHEETDISEQVEAALWKLRLNLKHFIGHTLYHKEDLPFPIKDIPDSFAVFKKKVERESTVRPCIATPEAVSTPDIADAGEIPTLAALGLEEPVDDPRSVYCFPGGETAGLQQLGMFLTPQSPQGGKTARKQAPDDYSSRLSPWIALGCVSLRRVYWEAVKNQPAHHHNAMVLDLLWRDYFRFMFKKHGQRFIAPEGHQPETPVPGAAQDTFNSWKNGETGAPLVDAIMHELNATGYINNYSRQVAAWYLVHELNANWMDGAAYFEEKLIDYSPASNWGNWAFIAGVNDARESRYAITAGPAAALETKSAYTDTWLSGREIADLAR